MGYQRLAQDDRYQIAALKKSGMGVRKIALELKRAPSTVSRELRRNGAWMGYNGQLAHLEATARRKDAARNSGCKIHGILEVSVREKLEQHWSPEQIQGRFKRERGESPISYSSIYRFIYRDAKKGGELWRCLRTQRDKRRVQKASILRNNLNIYKNVRSISDRPQIVNEKRRLGDLERDLVVGTVPGGAILTINDRVSKVVKIGWIKRKTSQLIHEKTVSLLKGRATPKTLTNDHGAEFALYRETEKVLKTKIYFSHKGCAWERGANENTNGLLRQYFPRSTDFDLITEAQIRDAEKRLNTRPRKTLGYQTPLEVQKILGQVLR